MPTLIVIVIAGNMLCKYMHTDMHACFACMSLHGYICGDVVGAVLLDDILSFFFWGGGS